jgi:lysophospholipase L1-like esterase
VTSPDRSYPSQLAKLFTNDTGKQIKVDNLGAGGSTSTDVLKAVKANASKFHNARLITVGVGFDDIGVADYEYATGHCDAASCYKNALRTFKGNWEAILKTINANCKPGYTTVLFRNNYTRNPDSSYDYYYMTSLNSYLAKAAAHYKWPVYDLRSDFDGPSPWTQPLNRAWLSPDGGHPNASGNRVIAQGYERVAKGFAPNCQASKQQVRKHHSNKPPLRGK